MRLTVDGGAQQRTVLVPVDDATTVGQLAGVLELETVKNGAGDAARDLLLSDTTLLNGATIPPSTSRTLTRGTVRLEVVGGPYAGRTVELPEGQPLPIGSGTRNFLRITDPHLFETHATMTLGAAQFGEQAAPGRPTPLLALLTPQPEAPVLVNGAPITEPTRIAPIDLIQLGSSLVRIGIEPVADADISSDPRGIRAFNRPSRIRPDSTAPTVTLPGEKPDDGDKSPLPWLSAIVPVMLGVTMAVVFDRPIMLLMAAASPIMVIGSYMVNQRLAKRKGERTEAQWIDEVKTARSRIAELVRLQRVRSWFDHPDPVQIRDIALHPRARLWERRFGDSDALVCRLGAGETDLSAQYMGGKKSDTGHSVSVSPTPITVDLAAGPIGIAGSAEAARSVARSMLTQLTTLRSPRDLRVVVICEDDAEAQWSWTQWLPHVASDAGPVAFIGNTDDTRRERLRELAAVIEQRQRSGPKTPLTEHVVVIVDGARDLRRLPGMVDLLSSGSAHGITTIALEKDRARLPEECRSTLVIDHTDASIAQLETASRFTPHVLVDGISLDDAIEIARSLCSIEHVSGAGDEGMIPASVRLADVAGIDLDDVDALSTRWNVNPRRSFVTVGATAESDFAIDLTSDGPHALVAGTTGSGKSEFLQTLVVSLALANRPDAMNFVLVDYKGGSAFADCERLPHTVGMVTNLDARETERALASLDAELKRRERVLAKMGAKDLESAWQRDPDAASAQGLARLVIVIDEFAELKTELPEFIDGIVRIARVGRSLGVHLVLATQRPSGVVTPEMQSNINLRVALRVTDRSDSSDILGTADAALIPPSLPGRGFVRSAISGAPTQFQTARVAGLRRGAQRQARATLPVADVTWETLGLPPQFPSRNGHQGPVDHDDTDLRALVNLCIEAARHAGIDRNNSPWLLPLDPVVTLDRFQAEPISPEDIVLGLQDLPAEQTQRPHVWSPISEGHLLFIGGARSGRTTALRTILAQAILRFSPSDLHLYIADYGNGALLPLADAHHTGAVITQSDHERLPRLMKRLLDDLERRQAALSTAGVGSIEEQREKVDPTQALPYAIVAIDGWERLIATFSADRLVEFRDHLMRILREGPAAGLRLVMTADRTFTGDKIASAIDTVHLLPMRDPNDYRAAGIMIRELPSALPPGRVLSGSDGLETQIAVLSREPSGQEQSVQLRQAVEDSRDYYDQFVQLAQLPTPFRVDPLPAHISLSSAFALPTLAGLPERGLVTGVGGDELSRITVDWDGITGFVVAGSRGSGRSTVLTSLLHQLRVAERTVIVVAPRPSVLTELAARESIPVVSDMTIEAGAFTELVSEYAGDDIPTLIVDDAEIMKQASIEFGITGIASRVSLIVSVESEAASSLFGGALVHAKRHQNGVVLAPKNTMVGASLFGTQIPKGLVGGRSVGAGATHLSGTWIPFRAAGVEE